MGNFSINHETRFDAGTRALHLRYILDLAEIPTVSEKSVMGASGSGTPTQGERDAYLQAKASELATHVSLTIDGQSVGLTPHPVELQLRPGAGGLDTLRLVWEAQVPLTWPKHGTHQVSYRDDNFADRLGWKEIVAVGVEGVGLADSTAATQDATQELTHYPVDPTLPPSQRTSARFTLIRSGGVTAIGTVADAGGSGAGSAAVQATGRAATPQDAFTQTISQKQLTPGLFLLGLAVAFVFGAFHALSPGHGKAMVAAYLVGARGTARHAVLLGLTVTFTHVLGVYLLGAVTLLASRYVVPERLYTWMSLISGAAVCLVGASLFRQRLRGVVEGHHDHSHDHSHNHDHDHSHDHSHSHDDTHSHDHEHVHEHDHTHSHADDDVQPHDHVHEHDHSHSHSHDHSHGHGHHHHHHLPDGPITVRGLIALGISGGIVPCPSALVVLLSAIALHRVLYGMLLITAFSAGLAAVLVAIGMTVVSARQWVKRLPTAGPLLQRLPVASAAIITLVGVGLILGALRQGTP
jgi:ABC-type nickel/cobalt efflux system permease component RcnA